MGLYLAGFNQPREFDYTRSGSPTRDALARALAEFEGGEGAVVTSSGMSAMPEICSSRRQKRLQCLMDDTLIFAQG